MKTLIHIIKFEWKLLSRNWGLKILLFVTIITGLYAIYFGKLEVNRQKSQISYVKQVEKQALDSILQWAKLDSSVVENKSKYLKAISPQGSYEAKHFTYYMANSPSPIAGLSLGQRDLFPLYYAVDISDLSRQMNVAEIVNVMKLFDGNFDFSYFIVFLIPLLIIVTFHNLYSEEKEGGTLLLLKSHPISLNKILISKGLVRFFILLMLNSILLIIGFLMHEVSIVNHFPLLMDWFLVIFFYQLFWALVILGIVSFKKNSAFSAIAGLAVWITLTLIIPSLLNLLIGNNAEFPNRSEGIHEARNLNNKIWESSKSYTFQKISKIYPNYEISDSTDFNIWQHLGFLLLDRKYDSINSILEKKVIERNDLINKWKWLSPPVLVSEKLASISKTDRNSQKNFIKKIRSKHQKLKNIYYPKILKKKMFIEEGLYQLKEIINN